jgi:hypothetical protein
VKPDLDPWDAEWLERNHYDLMAFRRRMAEHEARKHSPRARATRFVLTAFVVAVFTVLCLALAISNLPAGALP